MALPRDYRNRAILYTFPRPYTPTSRTHYPRIHAPEYTKRGYVRGCVYVGVYGRGKGWEPRYRHPSPSPCPSNQENLLKIPGIFLVPWDGKTGLSFNHYIILSSPCQKPRDFLRFLVTHTRVNAYRALTRSCGRNILCLGACMGVEGSWYLISYNQDPTTPTIPLPRLNILCGGDGKVGKESLMPTFPFPPYPFPFPMPQPSISIGWGRGTSLLPISILRGFWWINLEAGTCNHYIIRPRVGPAGIPREPIFPYGRS